MPIAIPSPTPKCHGYILTSQHPTFPTSGVVADPYAIIPCPFEPSAPGCLSEACGGSPGAKAGGKQGGEGGKRKTGCAKGKWCERHWCGKCKTAREEREGVHGLSHGVSPVREEFKVELKEGFKKELFGGVVA